LGGGIRQTGWLTVCGIVALQKENIDFLRQDHRNAFHLAQSLVGVPGLKVDMKQVQTNFVLMDISGLSGQFFLEKLREQGVLATLAGSDLMCLVTSRVVNSGDIDYAVGIIDTICQEHRESTFD